MPPTMHSDRSAMPAHSPLRASGLPRGAMSNFPSGLLANPLTDRGVQIFAAVVAVHACALAALPGAQRHARTTDPIIITMLQAPATAVHPAATAMPTAQPSPRTPPRAFEPSLNTAASESLPVRPALPDLEASSSMTMPRAGTASPAATPAVDSASAPSATRVRTASAYNAAPVVAALTPPRFDAAYLDNPAPTYPAAARRLGEQGRVLLRVHVSPDGRPRDIETAASSGSPRLDSAARSAVEHWRFVPARQGEQAVAAWVLVPLTFTMTSTAGNS